MFEVPSRLKKLNWQRILLSLFFAVRRLLQKIVDKLSLLVHWVVTHLGLTVVNELNESKEPRP